MSIPTSSPASDHLLDGSGPTSPFTVTLRSASEADLGLLQEIYASTRSEELALMPWRAEEKSAFVRHQFSAQHRHYVAVYPDAEFSVIEIEGRPVGRLYIHRTMGELRIVEFTLLPVWRGKGLGTQILQRLQQQAAAAGDAITLHVENGNPALKLYQRLGFRAMEENGLHTLMRWSASVGI